MADTGDKKPVGAKPKVFKLGGIGARKVSGKLPPPPQVLQEDVSAAAPQEFRGMFAKKGAKPLETRPQGVEGSRSMFAAAVTKAPTKTFQAPKLPSSAPAKASAKVAPPAPVSRKPPVLKKAVEPESESESEESSSNSNSSSSSSNSNSSSNSSSSNSDSSSNSNSSSNSDSSSNSSSESNESTPPRKRPPPLPKRRGFNPELVEQKALMEKEEAKDRYETDTKVYIPDSRRGFRTFLTTTYSGFTLPPILSAKINPNACSQMTLQTYKYQAFIREYMRQASPYRGVLVYHGLGSGKTCTSIAAAEAIYGSSKKKIIVLTPSSLQENYLNELMTCGFRHFRLKNVWVRYSARDEMNRIFARVNLKIPSFHLNDVILKRENPKQQVFWMPDLSQPDDASNFDDLKDWERNAIREQIYAVLKSRIEFIGYTGVTKTKLFKWILEKNHFDDRVIVIDEVHNLTRLMRGKIDRFLLSGGTAHVRYEPVTVDYWDPKFKSGIDPKHPEAAVIRAAEIKYDRAFLIYRLLAEARRSKIIALSGTPIVNFPEEIGILSNILRGYFHCTEDTVEGSSDELKAKAESILKKHPHVDFYEVKKGTGFLTIFYSMLPEGYRKLFSDDSLEGIIHVDPEDEEEGDEMPSQYGIRDIHAQIAEEFGSAGLKLKSVTSPKTNPPKFTALPVLPPTVDKFREKFIDMTSVDDSGTSRMLNRNVFLKRMAGLVSYYKGSKEELMPTVIRDEVVPCVMSKQTLGKYAKVREKERESEKSSKKPWQQANELAQSESKSSSYRFRSRAICNFNFPEFVPRPFPIKAKDFKNAAKIDENMFGDTGETALDDDDETEGGKEDREEEAEEQAAADAEVDAEGEREAEEEAEEEEESSVNREARLAAEEAAHLEELKGQILNPSILYEKRVAVAFNELSRVKDRIFKVGPGTENLPQEQKLETYSSKFKNMIDRIEASPGSSLVYSQFRTLEGIGIFSLVLEANGYAPLKIVGEGFHGTDNMRFSEETEKSLRENPSQPRYIVYSGEEPRRMRQTLIDIFNYRLEKLPTAIAEVMREVTDPAKKNFYGEICKVFMITGAGAEGLSLRNVRSVHIMEPHWNKVRTDQVKGRAVRICSHSDLPYSENPDENERTVEVFTYLTTFNKDEIDETLLVLDNGETSDEHIYRVSNAKENMSNLFLNAMKETAIDCEINKSENEAIKCFVIPTDTPLDFLTDPRLDKDIELTAQQFSDAPPAPVAVKPQTAPPGLAGPYPPPGIEEAPAETISFFKLPIRGVEKTFMKVRVKRPGDVEAREYIYKYETPKNKSNLENPAKRPTVEPVGVAEQGKLKLFAKKK